MLARPKSEGAGSESHLSKGIEGRRRRWHHRAGAFLVYRACVNPRIQALWQKQNVHEGDRERLFTAVRAAIGDSTVLYPGSYVDIAASFVFSTVTYVDKDRRAAQFFGDEEGVREIIASHRGPRPVTVKFIPSDYTTDLALDSESFDLLVSLYAGFVSEACTRYLRVGGTLLAVPSHGDVAMASIDSRYELTGIVTSQSDGYEVEADDLGTHLIPKKPTRVTPEYLHGHGRHIPYTKSPFAYLFTRTR